MTKRTMIIALALIGSAAAAQNGDIMKKAINTPSVSYNLYGPTQTSKRIKDDGVVGGQALRVDVTAKGPENYSTGASSSLSKPVVKGHRITVAFWARAPKMKGDETTPIPFFGVIGPAPAYVGIATGSADVGSAWKLYDATGTAPADFAADAASVTLHLGAAKTMIDLGPVFVIDMDAPG